MDEFHNISERYGKVHERKKLRALKDWLTTAKDAVVVGLTATPIISKPDDAEELLRVIRGPGKKGRTNDGFITYFNDLHRALYPTLSDLNGNPRVNDTMGTVRRVPLHRSEYAIETSKRERSQDAAQTTTTTALAAYESRAKSMFGDLAVYDRIMASSEAKLLVPLETDREVDAFQKHAGVMGAVLTTFDRSGQNDLPSTNSKAAERNRRQRFGEQTSHRAATGRERSSGNCEWQHSQIRCNAREQEAFMAEAMRGGAKLIVVEKQRNNKVVQKKTILPSIVARKRYRVQI